METVMETVMETGPDIGGEYVDSLWGRGANGAEILGLSQSHLQSMLILNMLILYIIMNISY